MEINAEIDHHAIGTISAAHEADLFRDKREAASIANTRDHMGAPWLRISTRFADLFCGIILTTSEMRG